MSTHQRPYALRYTLTGASANGDFVIPPSIVNGLPLQVWTDITVDGGRVRLQIYRTS